jgi:transcriptional regulator with XRE-family HTH domain
MQFDNVGDLIIRLRKQRGMTQMELAALAGINPGTISRIETEDTRRLKTIKNLLASLGYELVAKPLGE